MSANDFMNIAAAWKSFAEASIDDDTEPEAREVARNIFYSGAGALLVAQRNIHNKHQCTDAAMILMDAIREELANWAWKV